MGESMHIRIKGHLTLNGIKSCFDPRTKRKRMTEAVDWRVNIMVAHHMRGMWFVCVCVCVCVCSARFEVRSGMLKIQVFWTWTD